MTIPTGIPILTMVVKNGMGGPEKNAIPAKDDLGGGVIGYLKNDTVVRVVDPTYPGISKYRRISNGTTWVVFAETATRQVVGDDVWCELTGHLVAVAPPPPVVDEAVTYEILAESWEGGKRFIRVKII